MPLSLHAADAAAHAAVASGSGNQAVGVLAFAGFIAFWVWVFRKPRRNRQR